jgi:hypothetical protein
LPLQAVQEAAMGKRTAGNDPVEGADPGGTHSTKPGNPDKSGAAKPGRVAQTVESGDRNDGAHPGRDPAKHPDT